MRRTRKSRYANGPSCHRKGERPISKKGHNDEQEDTEDKHDVPQRGRKELAGAGLRKKMERSGKEYKYTDK